MILFQAGYKVLSYRARNNPCRGSDRRGESEEETEIARCRQARDEKTWHRGLKGVVEKGEAVATFDAIQKVPRFEHGCTPQIDLVSRRVEYVVDLYRVPGIEPDVQRPGTLLAATDACSGMDRNRVVTHTRAEPRLQLEPPLSPETSVERFPLDVRQATIPPWFVPNSLYERVDPRPVRRSEGRRLVPMADMDGRGSRLGEQRRRFERTLPPTHDEDALAAESAERDTIAGMGAPVSGHQRRKLVRDAGKRQETERQEDAVRPHHRAVVQGRRETTVALIQSRNPRRPRTDVLHPFEPLGVLQVEVQRERLDVGRGLAAHLEKALDGVAFRGVKVPVATRAEHHAFGHVALPERHWSPEQDVVDTSLSGVDGHGQSKWPGADDEKRGVQ